MNKKIYTFLLMFSSFLLFCVATLLAFIYLAFYDLEIFIIVILIFYLVNLFFLYDNFSKQHSSSQAKVTWTIVLLFLPFYGMFFYFLGGYTSKRKKKKLNQLFILESEFAIKAEYSKVNTDYEIFHENLNLQNRKIITNTDFILYDNGTKKFKNLVKDLEEAKNFINIQYFIINNGIIWNKIQDILIKKANQGVKINILADYFGCIQTSPSAFDKIKNSKINFHMVNPTNYYFNGGHLNHRAHNKFIIIDNKKSYFGGMNLGDDYSNMYSKYGVWFDLQISFIGELTNEFNNHFIAQWKHWTGEDLEKYEPYSFERNTLIQFSPDGPNFNESTFLNYFIKLIDNAKKEIKIVTPYIVMPKIIYKAFLRAKKRGVNIELITAGRADKKTAYEIGKIYIRDLINIGIKVYRVENIFIHSKFYLFDEDITLTGTTNIDYRAIYLHFESNLLIKDEKLNKELFNLFELYKSHSIKQNSNEYNSFLYKIKSPIYHFFTPMF